MMDPEKKKDLLPIDGLTVHYVTMDGTFQAVRNLSLNLKEGTTLGLVGETGAGKTTIALSIMRLIPNPPGKIMGGEILFHGENLLKKPEAQMRKIRGHEISMIFQDPMTALNPIDTVGDQIREVILIHEKISKSEATVKACEMLEMVGIPRERYKEYPHQFSGGMKQRVVIAMALACTPKLLIADEPTTALDVTIQAQVLEMMNDLKRKTSTSMILITHDLGVVAKMCDNVAVVYAGQVIESGTAEDIFDRVAHPYTKGLFAALPKITGTRGRLATIPGLMPDPSDLPEGCSFHPRCEYCCEECCTGEISMTEITPGHFVRCRRIAELLAGTATKTVHEEGGA